MESKNWIILLSIEKINGNTFWDSKWQSKQGIKGGKIGGSKNTQKQYISRKKVGLNYGFGLNTEIHKKARKRGGLKNSNKQKIARSKVGISQQTPKLRKFISKTTIWEYKIQDKKFKISLPPQESVIEILNFLKKEIPNLKNTNTNIYNIINGRTHKMFIKKSSNRIEVLSLFFIIL